MKLQALLCSNKVCIFHDLRVNVFGLQKEGSGGVFKLTFKMRWVHRSRRSKHKERRKEKRNVSHGFNINLE